MSQRDTGGGLFAAWWQGPGQGLALTRGRFAFLRPSRAHLQSIAESAARQPGLSLRQDPGAPGQIGGRVPPRRSGGRGAGSGRVWLPDRRHQGAGGHVDPRGRRQSARAARDFQARLPLHAGPGQLVDLRPVRELL